MIKQIPKSSRSVRPFKVYKQWSFTHEDVDVLNASNTELGNFDRDTHAENTPLWRSIRKQYYSDPIAGVDSLGYRKYRINSTERQINEDGIKIINIPPSIFGERIKPGSVKFTNPNDEDFVATDDGFSNIFRTDSDFVSIINIDFQAGTFSAVDGTNINSVVLGNVIEFDAQDEFIILEVDGETATFDVIILDIQEGFLQLTTRATIGNIDFGAPPMGNVFYEQGLIILTKFDDAFTYDFEEFNLEFKSTVTIYEHEFLLSVEDDEFNLSTNPTAIEWIGERPETASIELLPSGKEVEYKILRGEAIRKPFFTSSFDSTVSGSFNDYNRFKLTDPTGSYLTPYITTIALYNDDLEMLAIAKLPQPVKSLPDYPVNFIVRLDT